MFRIRTVTATVAVGLVASATVLSSTPAMADAAPQEKDVVSTGSDILQTAYNFLADGYGDLPGYNTAGNRWRFINFDSSGDAQGRSAYIDPRQLPTTTVGADKYVKLDDVKLLNPTIALRAGQPLVVRPSGGGAGGRDAILNDYLDDQGVGDWIDVGRSPDPVDPPGSTTRQGTAQSQLGTKLYSVVFGTDRQVIATASTTNAPDTLSATAIRNIYSGVWKTWGEIPGYVGTDEQKAATIIPLTLPSDAGMWNTFINGVASATQLTFSNTEARQNPNSFNVQQNDPTAIAALPEAQRVNAIVPFPRSRYRVVNKGYYTVPDATNQYNGVGTATIPNSSLKRHRTAATASAIKLLAADSTTSGAAAPYGTNFSLRAIFRENDYTANGEQDAWQPGSTLNWVKTLFYNPGGATPFVKSPAGRALIEAAGIEPDYKVYGTDNNEIPQD